MKKSLVSALTTALVVGAASTTFAASNPFSDVPADHWSYDAVTQLAQDGVINGFGDGTYRGDKNITRYEMAQMVAKAMAKSDVSAKDKALIDKLAAEFSDELNNLGVRVANLEKHADMVKWNGLAEYTFTNTKVQDGDNQKNYELVFRLEPTAEVNEHWNIHARMDGVYKLNTDDNGRGGASNVELKRAWAEGDYDKFNIKLGKLPNSINLLSLTDDPYSGAEVSYGKTGEGLKVTLAAGNINENEFGGRWTKYNGSLNFNGYDSLDSGYMRYYGLGVQYDKEDQALSGGAAYQILDMSKLVVSDSTSALANSTVDAVRNGKDARYGIWSLNAKYKFAEKAYFKAEYAKANADLNGQDGHNQAYSFQLGYGEAKHDQPGAWGAYLAYRKLGLTAAPWSTYDDAIQSGQKGWEIGGEYTFAKNVVGFLKYGQGSDITRGANGKDDARKFFGRVDFFF